MNTHSCTLTHPSTPKLIGKRHTSPRSTHRPTKLALNKHRHIDLLIPICTYTPTCAPPPPSPQPVSETHRQFNTGMHSQMCTQETAPTNSITANVHTQKHFCSIRAHTDVPRNFCKCTRVSTHAHTHTTGFLSLPRSPCKCDPYQDKGHHLFHLLRPLPLQPCLLPRGQELLPSDGRNHR